MKSRLQDGGRSKTREQVKEGGGDEVIEGFA
jgi:hypothetical protein